MGSGREITPACSTHPLIALYALTHIHGRCFGKGPISGSRGTCNKRDSGFQGFKIQGQECRLRLQVSGEVERFRVTLNPKP